MHSVLSFGRARAAILSLAALMVTMASSSAAEIRVYSGGAPKEVLAELVPEFEKRTGHKVQITYAVISAIQQKLAAGDHPDMVLMPVPALDALVTAGTMRAEPRPALGTVSIGMVVGEGAPLPDISTTDKFRNVLLNARSVVHANPNNTPSGAHLARVIAALGIAEAMQQKITFRNALDGGVEAIQKGHAEIGIYPLSEIISVKGITLVGLLPPEQQAPIVYGAAVLTSNANPEPAAAFIKFLAAPEHRAAWKHAGFEPAGN
jgi:molybdate transport system substrate-binding protein